MSYVFPKLRFITQWQNSSPQSVYNKVCGLLCDLSKQTGQTCVSHLSVKPLRFWDRTSGSQVSFDKSKL